jgi:hypothetical protein
MPLKRFWKKAKSNSSKRYKSEDPTREGWDLACKENEE